MVGAQRCCLVVAEQPSLVAAAGSVPVTSEKMKNDVLWGLDPQAGRQEGAKRAGACAGIHGLMLTVSLCVAVPFLPLLRELREI